MNTTTLQRRYTVHQYVDGAAKRVGTITANNHTAATSKAIRLFNNKVWVERLD